MLQKIEGSLETKPGSSKVRVLAPWEAGKAPSLVPKECHHLPSSQIIL